MNLTDANAKRLFLLTSPPVVEYWCGLRVVRDDMLPGGTKSRAIHLLFDSEHEEYVYAGPCQGYAQVALAYACSYHGKRATLFVAKRKGMHSRTAKAVATGANVIEVPHGYLSNVRSKAELYCRDSGALILPFGLEDPRMISGIAEAARQIPIEPTEVWSVAGSGTLSLALQEAWPAAVVNAVMIGKQHESIGRAKLWVAPESYKQPAKHPPPFPSCDNYDAKLWQFVMQYASPGALVWNVAS